jgi:pyruvate/2-oxoacid:ferredoxin oxidoreductase beta subunit/intein/homing endonuclease
MATLKELSHRQSALTAGHRMCAGCAAPIIIKMITLSSPAPIVAGCATGCLEVATTIFPYTAWRSSFIHNAFENSAATVSGVETAYRALKKRGKIKEDIKFIAIGGDGGTYDIGLQSLSGAMERGHDMLYVCYDNEAYMNCLSTASMIMTKDGLKKITDIKVNDEVYAFSQKTHQLVLKKCSGVFDNGIKDVYRLETLHHSIKATSNHPFLTVQHRGRGKDTNLVWKTLEQLKTDDEVIVLKNLQEGESYKFNFKPAKKGDYKVNRINEINIPGASTSDLMKYLGIYLGDGWTRAKKAEVDFALPKGQIVRKDFLSLHSKIFGNSIRVDNSYVHVKSVNLARFIDSLGFGNGAKNKTIPDWIFTLPTEEKESFVEGLMSSDGYKCGNSWRYVSASQDLLKNLRLLLQTMDIRVGKIHSQTKTKGTQCVYRPLLKDSTYGYVCFSKKSKWNVKKYPSQYKYQNFLIGNKHFTAEKIKSITLVGKEPTLDLRVEDEHNFIADGIVVHNTGVQRSGATPRGAATTTCPAGSEIPGKVQFRKDLTAIMVAHGIPYVAQGSPGHSQDLMKKAEKAFSIKGPKFMNVFMPCNLGWGFLQDKAIELAKLAVETCFWPLYEVEDGKWKVTYVPKEKKPVTEFLKTQKRFAHLFKGEEKQIIDEIQARVDKNWDALLKKSEK